MIEGSTVDFTEAVEACIMPRAALDNALVSDPGVDMVVEISGVDGVLDGSEADGVLDGSEADVVVGGPTVDVVVVDGSEEEALDNLCGILGCSSVNTIK